jgi:orotate phosphoribosyltransferase
MVALAMQESQARTEDVLGHGDPRWVRLQELIRQHSRLCGNFTLSSGRTSNYLFQLRQTTLLPEGAALLGDVILEYMNRKSIRSVGGLVLGAVPLVSAAAVVSHTQGRPINAFFVRKTAKEHGARERIDGHIGEGEVLVVDDVATSGGSLLKAVGGLQEESRSNPVHHALVVVDREEGAAENLARFGIQLAAIFRRSDFPELS